TILVGWLLVRAADRAVGLTILTKSVVAALAGTAVALVNVLVVARLMFVSTTHDLGLLVALTVFGAIVTVFFSTWLSTATASRLERIATSVRSLAGGIYDDRIDSDGHDEVARLALDINLLAARLQAIE